MDMEHDRAAIAAGSEESAAVREAIGSLQYIRETIERTERFSAIPGWGGVAMGIIAVVAAVIAGNTSTPAAWLSAWLLAAGLAVLVGVVTMILKARRTGTPMLIGAGRKFAMGLLPTLFVASVLTLVLFRADLYHLLPGLWLLMFGLATVTAGMWSVPVVPIMGICYMVLGMAAFVVPASWGDAMMAIGFGGLNILFGVVIGRWYGG